MSGEFFQGLAKGVFGAQAKANQDALDAENKQRMDTLHFLGGLADQVDDESKPLLYKQMAEVAQLKGPHRGIWDQLTGSNRSAGKDAFTSKQGAIVDMLRSSGQMNQLRPHPEIQGTESPVASQVGLLPMFDVGQSPDRSQGLIGLQSPSEQELKTYKAKQKLLNSAKSDMLDKREQAILDRHNQEREALTNDKLTLQQKAAELKAHGDTLKLATTYATQNGRTAPNRDDLKLAADQIAKDTGLKSEALQGLVGVRVADKQLKEAEAKAMFTTDASGNQVFQGKPMTQSQRATFDQTQQTKAQQVYDAWGKARSEALARSDEIKGLYDRVNAATVPLGFYLDPTTKALKSTSGKPIDTNSFTYQQLTSGGKLKSLMDELQRAETSKSRASEEMKVHHAILKSQFPDYYEVGDENWVKPRESFGGVAPAGAPRTVDARDKGSKVGNIADSIEVFGTESKPAAQYKVGQIVNMGGSKHIVTSIGEPDEDYPHGRVYLKSVK